MKNLKKGKGHMTDLTGYELGPYRVLRFLSTAGPEATYLGERLNSKDQVLISILSARAGRRETRQFRCNSSRERPTIIMAASDS